MGQIKVFVQRMICIPIRLYQCLVSPFLPPRCRFHPSCSQYAIDAITRHGIFYGVWLGIRRLMRCHPWSAGGYDPVLPKPKEKH